VTKYYLHDMRRSWQRLRWRRRRRCRLGMLGFDAHSEVICVTLSNVMCSTSWGSFLYFSLSQVHKSSTRVFVSPWRLEISAEFLHRLKRVVRAASRYDYVPYSELASIGKHAYPTWFIGICNYWIPGFNTGTGSCDPGIEFRFKTNCSSIVEKCQN
jgi:hypothetical protein